MTILSANRDPTAPYFVQLYATFQDAHRLCEKFNLELFLLRLRIIFMFDFASFRHDLCLWGRIIKAA